MQKTSKGPKKPNTNAPQNHKKETRPGNDKIHNENQKHQNLDKKTMKNVGQKTAKSELNKDHDSGSGSQSESEQDQPRLVNGHYVYPDKLKKAKETFDIINNGCYPNKISNEYVMINTSFMLEHSQFVSDDDDVKIPAKRKPNQELCLIEVTHEKTYQAAFRIKKKLGIKQTVALNFASATSPGGGWLNGREAQEESITRQSTLYLSLNKFKRQFYDMHTKILRDFSLKRNLYTHAMIYSPNVTVIRDPDTEELLGKPYLVSVITSAAPNLKAILNDYERYFEEQKAKEKKKTDPAKKGSKRSLRPTTTPAHYDEEEPTLKKSSMKQAEKKLASNKNDNSNSNDNTNTNNTSTENQQKNLSSNKNENENKDETNDEKLITQTNKAIRTQSIPSNKQPAQDITKMTKSENDKKPAPINDTQHSNNNDNKNSAGENSPKPKNDVNSDKNPPNSPPLNETKSTNNKGNDSSKDQGKPGENNSQPNSTQLTTSSKDKGKPGENNSQPNSTQLTTSSKDKGKPGENNNQTKPSQLTTSSKDKGKPEENNNQTKPSQSTTSSKDKGKPEENNNQTKPSQSTTSSKDKETSTNQSSNKSINNDDKKDQKSLLKTQLNKNSNDDDNDDKESLINQRNKEIIDKAIENNYEVLKERIKRILSLALAQGNRAIVLGAFGCGIFENDPVRVSKIFKELLVDDHIGYYFDVVVFAIIGSDDSKNYTSFVSTFKKYLKTGK